MRIVAILATFNEARFIAGSIEHLREQGVDVHLIDNESTDATVAIAERYVGAGVIGIETLPRAGASDLYARLMRKEELAQTLDADWLMHVDADEFHIAAAPRRSLAQAFAEADAAGFNAVNFIEYTFVPTREHPDHDHPDFARTMRHYYPFLPWFPHRLNAWKRQEQRVDLTWMGVTGCALTESGWRPGAWRCATTCSSASSTRSRSTCTAAAMYRGRLRRAGTPGGRGCRLS